MAADVSSKSTDPAASVGLGVVNLTVWILLCCLFSFNHVARSSLGIEDISSFMVSFRVRHCLC
jgi:hypothetical protein